VAAGRTIIGRDPYTPTLLEQFLPMGQRMPSVGWLTATIETKKFADRHQGVTRRS
jgi:hypothetical protein